MQELNLDSYGITGLKVLANLSVAELCEEAIRNDQRTCLSSTGALVAYSGGKGPMGPIRPIGPIGPIGLPALRLRSYLGPLGGVWSLSYAASKSMRWTRERSMPLHFSLISPYGV